MMIVISVVEICEGYMIIVSMIIIIVTLLKVDN